MADVDLARGEVIPHGEPHLLAVVGVIEEVLFEAAGVVGADGVAAADGVVAQRGVGFEGREGALGQRGRFVEDGEREHLMGSRFEGLRGEGRFAVDALGADLPRGEVFRRVPGDGGEHLLGVAVEGEVALERREGAVGAGEPQVEPVDFAVVGSAAVEVDARGLLGAFGGVDRAVLAGDGERNPGNAVVRGDEGVGRGELADDVVVLGADFEGGALGGCVGDLEFRSGVGGLVDEVRFPRCGCETRATYHQDRHHLAFPPAGRRDAPASF